MGQRHWLDPPGWWYSRNQYSMSVSTGLTPVEVSRLCLDTIFLGLLIIYHPAPVEFYSVEGILLIQWLLNWHCCQKNNNDRCWGLGLKIFLVITYSYLKREWSLYTLDIRISLTLIIQYPVLLMIITVSFLLLYSICLLIAVIW